MGNRLTQAINDYRAAWDSVSTEVSVVERSDERSEYRLAMVLDGEVIVRARVTVVHLGEPWLETTFVYYETDGGEPLPGGLRKNDPDVRQEQAWRELAGHLRWQHLHKALQAAGIPTKRMNVQSGSRPVHPG